MLLVFDHAVFCICRGNDFRPEYGKLGVLRSLIRAAVPIVAMTATASVHTRDVILQRLHMSDPVFVDETPDKSNIFYGVLPQTSVEKLASLLAKGIQHKGIRYPKTIVFCRR